MLQKIRKTTDSLFFRIFLGIIVVAFSIWGISDVIKSRGNVEMVTFKIGEPITYENFSKAKAEEIKNIQRNEGANFSEEQLEEMNLNEIVIHKLIRNKLLEYLVQTYNLDFSDAVIADVIKTLPQFKNPDNQFDIEKFKSYLRLNGLTTEEYSKEIKSYLANTLIMGSFIGNAYIPSTRIDNIMDYMSERRVVDIASISLNGKDSKELSDITEAQLRNFYKENKDMFKTAWVRDISYVLIDKNATKTNVNDDEIKQFFDDNKEEFAGKNFNSIKREIKERLQKQKFDLWIVELAKSLEDEVAGGSSLEEIANKYNLKLISEKNVTAKNMESKANGLFGAFDKLIYQMTEKEVSYPADFQDKGMVLFEISKYIPETQQEFEQVKVEVESKYKAFAYRQSILKKLQDLSTNINSASFLKETSSLGMNIQYGRSFVRSELININNLSPEILLAMFSTSKDTVVGPFISDDTAYMIAIRKVMYDNSSLEKNNKYAKVNISARIKEGLMEELLFYITKENRMKVKLPPNALKKPNNEL